MKREGLPDMNTGLLLGTNLATTLGALLGSVLIALSLGSCRSQQSGAARAFIQHGQMHEAIGAGLHHGRVALSELADRPHVYGVGALAGLEGEVTLLDSTAIVTGVTDDGLPRPIEHPAAEATLFAGQSVSRWTHVPLTESVPADRFEHTLAARVSEHDVDDAEPFVFVIEGGFTDVRLHVINGACPIRARMTPGAVDESLQPFAWEALNVPGTLVGIHAIGAAGKLTHPGTSVHAHLVFTDPGTGARLTGHVEQIGVAAGAVLRLPAGDE